MMEADERQIMAMTQFGHLDNRSAVHFVEAKLREAIPHPSCAKCGNVRIETHENMLSAQVQARASCSHDRGGVCPDGMPVGDFNVMIHLPDDINAPLTETVTIHNSSTVNALSGIERVKALAAILASQGGARPFMTDAYGGDSALTESAFGKNASLGREPYQAPVNKDIPRTLTSEAW